MSNLITSDPSHSLILGLRTVLTMGQGCRQSVLQQGEEALKADNRNAELLGLVEFRSGILPGNEQLRLRRH